MTTETRHNPQAWLDHHGDVLFRFALARVGNSTAAEDLVQDTLLAALRNRASFAERSAERTWLVGILKHRIADHYRELARQLVVAENAADEASGGFSRGGKWLRPPRAWQAPDSALASVEFAAILRDCLAGLPERSAAALTLRESAGMSGEEICKELQVTPTHLWTLLHRARMRLRECLEVRWFCGDARGSDKRKGN